MPETPQRVMTRDILRGIGLTPLVDTRCNSFIKTTDLLSKGGVVRGNRSLKLEANRSASATGTRLFCEAARQPLKYTNAPAYYLQIQRVTVFGYIGERN